MRQCITRPYSSRSCASALKCGVGLSDDGMRLATAKRPLRGARRHSSVQAVRVCATEYRQPRYWHRTRRHLRGHCLMELGTRRRKLWRRNTSYRQCRTQPQHPRYYQLLRLPIHDEHEPTRHVSYPCQHTTDTDTSAGRHAHTDAVHRTWLRSPLLSASSSLLLGLWPIWNALWTSCSSRKLFLFVVFRITSRVSQSSSTR